MAEPDPDMQPRHNNPDSTRYVKGDPNPLVTTTVTFENPDGSSTDYVAIGELAGKNLVSRLTDIGNGTIVEVTEEHGAAPPYRVE